jgi:hypothetical protein
VLSAVNTTQTRTLAGQYGAIGRVMRRTASRLRFQAGQRILLAGFQGRTASVLVTRWLTAIFLTSVYIRIPKGIAGGYSGS